MHGIHLYNSKVSFRKAKYTNSFLSIGCTMPSILKVQLMAGAAKTGKSAFINIST